MNSAAIGRRLEDLGLVDDPSQRQLELLASLSEIYEREGVLGATTPSSLYDCCPDANRCWTGAQDRVSRGATREGDGEDGSIFWPFVGSTYAPGGVCIVGWNINHNGVEWYGLQEEFAISDYDSRHLGAGYRTNEWHSRFAYRSLAAGVAVADSLDGVRPVVDPKPEILADDMQRLARLQTVKCVPLGERSNPPPAMTSACPRRYLVQELDILRPSAIVIFGEDALNAVCEALETDDERTWITWDPQFTHGYARGAQPLGLTIFGLWHPSYFDWPSCQSTLVADLLRRPLSLDREPQRQA